MGPKRVFENDEPSEKPPKAAKVGHWSLGLLSAMKDPNLIVEDDDQVVAIKDKFPKAEVHYLVIPKDNIPSLKELEKEHLDLLSHMFEVGKRLADAEKDRTFKIGYHSDASMSRLHLHVISDDFNSSALKTKKHWNSFNTDFFIPHADVYKEVEEKGSVTMKTQAECQILLGHTLQCHKCKFMSDYMPKLKTHIVKHRKYDPENPVEYRVAERVKYPRFKQAKS